MRRFIKRLCISLVTFLLGLGVFLGLEKITGSPYSNQLTLTLVPETPILGVGETTAIKFHITNNGNETVTLVNPGDGSEVGWRTPILRWWVIEDGNITEHPTEFEGTRCGNIQALKWNEVFTVAPGETKVIDKSLWLSPFRKPGTYRVKFFYDNRPSMQWGGIELGTHNPIAMWRVRNSTECTLTSNEVIFTVNP